MTYRFAKFCARRVAAAAPAAALLGAAFTLGGPPAQGQGQGPNAALDEWRAQPPAASELAPDTSLRPAPRLTYGPPAPEAEGRAPDPAPAPQAAAPRSPWWVWPLLFGFGWLMGAASNRGR